MNKRANSKNQNNNKNMVEWQSEQAQENQEQIAF